MSKPNLKFPLLGDWQSKQAAMLYHFASLDYLKGLHRIVRNFLGGTVDPLLDLAEIQNRDAVLTDARWGTRNTAANWANNAWPLLKDFEVSLAKDIAGRSAGRYAITGVNQCLRGIAEYSMQWATVDEENKFNEIIKAISNYALKIDDTLNDYHNSDWDDYCFAYEYRNFASVNPRISRFRIRTDVVGQTGVAPRLTGVYVAQDDPHAALQFAWSGGRGGILRPSTTFNDIGLDALSSAGRQDLWFNEKKMFDFATSKKYADLFREDVNESGRACPSLAPSAVGLRAFKNRPCSWYFVEVIEGEFEEIGLPAVAEFHVDVRHRVTGGELCPETGFYFTPAHQSSRRKFVRGEIMPALQSEYGETIWQWDSQQS